MKLNKTENHNLDAIFLFLTYGLLTILLLFSVFRPEGLDHDYQQYLKLFEFFRGGGSGGLGSEVEPLYIYISRFVDFIGGDFLFLLFIYSFTSLACKYRFIKLGVKNNKSVLLFLLLYAVIFYPLHELTQIRISLALALLLYGLTLNSTIPFLVIMTLGMLSHYSLIPAVFLILLIRFSNKRIKPNQVVIFISMVCLFCFFMVIFIAYGKNLKYDGVNLPFYYYFIHPYSVVVFVSLIFIRKNKGYVVFHRELYFLALLYYLFFIAFLLLQSQVAAFRFIEISLFFVFIILFLNFSNSNNSIIDSICLFTIVSVLFLYEHVIADVPLLDINVFSNWVNDYLGGWI